MISLDAVTCRSHVPLNGMEDGNEMNGMEVPTECHSSPKSIRDFEAQRTSG